MKSFKIKYYINKQRKIIEIRKPFHMQKKKQMNLTPHYASLNL